MRALVNWILIALFFGAAGYQVMFGVMPPEQRRDLAILYISGLLLYLGILRWAHQKLRGPYQQLEETLARVRETEEQLARVRQAARDRNGHAG